MAKEGAEEFYGSVQKKVGDSPEKIWLDRNMEELKQRIFKLGIAKDDKELDDIVRKIEKNNH